MKTGTCSMWHLAYAQWSAMMQVGLLCKWTNGRMVGRAALRLKHVLLAGLDRTRGPDDLKWPACSTAVINQYKSLLPFHAHTHTHTHTHFARSTRPGRRQRSVNYLRLCYASSFASSPPERPSNIVAQSDIGDFSTTSLIDGRPSALITPL